MSVNLVKGLDDNCRWMGEDWPANRYIVISLSGEVEPNRHHHQIGTVNAAAMICRLAGSTCPGNLPRPMQRPWCRSDRFTSPFGGVAVRQRPGATKRMRYFSRFLRLATLTWRRGMGFAAGLFSVSACCLLSSLPACAKCLSACAVRPWTGLPAATAREPRAAASCAAGSFACAASA